jgi:hypothetical protein
VLGLTVEDPRVKFPPSKFKRGAGVVATSNSSLEMQIVENLSWSPSNATSLLWQSESVVESLEQKRNNSKHKVENHLATTKS